MRSRSLRFRITLTLLLFVTISSSCFGLAIFYVNARLEEQLLDDMLDLEFEEFEHRYQKDRQLPLPYSIQLKSYLVDRENQQSLPAAFWPLSPGTHHDIEMEGRVYHVLHRAMGDKHVYIALDISHIEQRESRLVLFLIFGVLTASLIAVWVGYLLSKRLIAPVTELASRVSTLDPERRRVSLTREFTGSEVELIAQAFDRYLQRLDSFVDREHAFTQDASHELRTPLAIIKSATELALGVASIPEPVRQPLKRILRASEHMRRLTSALLFLARESDGHAEDAERCHVDAVIADVTESFRQLHSGEAVLELGVVEPLSLPVPSGFMEIVVANLVLNALENTHQGRVRVSLQDGVLTVMDTGAGIGEGDLPHIFERHFRGPDSRGIGRGLDLVKRICDRYGWRIQVTSRPEQGSCFSVTLSEPPTRSP